MPENVDEEMARDIVELLDGDVLSLTEVADEMDLNPMYLSGFLHALSLIGVLEKKVKGATHIYLVKDKELLERLL